MFRTVDGVVLRFDSDGRPITDMGAPRPGPTIWELGGPDGTGPWMDPPPIVPAPAPPAPSVGDDVVAAVTALYRELLQRAPDPDGLAGWVTAVRDGRLTILGVRAGIMASSEYRQQHPSAPPAPPPDVPNPDTNPEPPPAPPAPSPGVFVNLNFVVTTPSGRGVYPGSVSLDTDFGNGATRTTDGNGLANFGVWLNAAISWHAAADGYVASAGRVVATDNPTTVAVTLAPIDAPPGGGGGSGGGRGPLPPVPPTPVPAGEIGALTPSPSGLAGAPSTPAYTRATFEARGGVPSLTSSSLALLDVPGFGFSPSAIFTSIVGGLIGLFKGSSGSADVSRLANVVQHIGDLLLKTVETLADLSSRSVHTETQTGRLADHILGGILGPIINALAAVIRGGSGDLGKLFGPLAKALSKVVDKVKHLYDVWLKPILHVIDVTRQVLRIAAALYIPFARELDAQLGRLEGKITGPYLQLLGELNKTRNVINRIVTLDGALQRVTLLQSHVKHAACINKVWWNSQASKPGQYAKQQLDPVPPTPTPDERCAAIGAAVNDNAGPHARQSDRILALISELSA